MLASALPCWAVDRTFLPTSGDWALPGNWSGGFVPGLNDRAIIPAGKTATLSASRSIDYLTVYGLVIIADTPATPVVLTVRCSGAINGAPFIDGTGEVRTALVANPVGPYFGTGRIEIPNAQSGMLVQQSITLGNFWLNYTNANPNTVANAKMRLNNGISVKMNGELNILVGNLELGQNPPGGATTLDVRGDVNIAGISFIDFKANNCVCICGGNWTQFGTKFKDGNNTTLIFNKAGDQTISVSNATIANIDYDNLILASTIPRTVTYNNNPLLVNSLQVNQNLLVGKDVIFIVNDGVDPTANRGIGDGSATYSLRIESNAQAIFKGNYNNSARLLFRDTSDAGPASNGLLRLERTITDDSTELGSAVDTGVGTVEYAGQSVAQTVWTRVNAVTPFSYYNLVIDNVGVGVTATQEAGGLLDVNANFTIRNAASSFTAAAGNMNVALDFIANGAFNAGTFTTTLDASGILGGTSPSLFFNNLFVSAQTADTRTVRRSFGAVATFQVTRGTLTTNGITAPITMTALSGLSVGDGIAGDGVLDMRGPATLAVQQNTTFLVNAADGRFVARSTALGTPTVTRVAGNTQRFTATVNGRVDITRMNFSFGGTDGLNITSTATIQNLRRIRFMSVNTGANSAHLTVAPAGLNHDAPGCYFDTLAGAGTVNVRATGAGSILRFEDRGASPPNAGGGGPGAGELQDGDADGNDDGVADAPAGGAVVQWLYTTNIDLTGSIQGFPMPAFDWNLGTTYSTYSLMRDASGVGTADTIFVLDPNGDYTNGATDAILGYSFTLSGADIVGPLWWDTEGGTHVVYFGTRDGKVYKLIDDTAAKQLRPATGTLWESGGLPSPFTHTSLTAVTSPLISDGTNLYFGGQGPSGTGVYKVVIATKAFALDLSLIPQDPIPTAGVEVATAPTWWDNQLGTRWVYFASGPPGGTIYRINTNSWMIEGLHPASSGCVAITNVMYSIPDPTPYLYVGELNGRMNAVKAAGTVGDFSVQRTGFPFSSSGAIRGGAIVDFYTNRVFFGNASGNIYTLGGVVTPAVIATGGGPIETMPLYQEGILYVSNKGGKVYCVDTNTSAGGQFLLRTYNFGTNALGDISRDGFSTGLLHVGTSGGRTYAIPPMIDPTVPH